MNCALCGGLVDVTGYNPGDPITCPICEQPTVTTWNMGPYTLVSKLGQGGMGAVYKGVDRNLDREAAIKVLKQELANDAKFIADFIREAQITASISHPNVVQVFGAGQEGNSYYLAMELITQGSLEDLMQKVHEVGEIEILRIGADAASGLQEAHSRGLIHRDVKPGNIVFGKDRIAKVVDFGLAASLEEVKDGNGEIWGTPYYIAPEKLDQSGEDHRSDIYSLGATLFHATAGRPPFEAADATQVALKHLKGTKVSLKAFKPNVIDETAYAINHCLERDPAARFQTYADLIENFEYALKMAKDKKHRKDTMPAPETVATVNNDEAKKLILLAVGATVLFIIIAVVLYNIWLKRAQGLPDF